MIQEQYKQHPLRAKLQTLNLDAVLFYLFSIIAI